MAISKLTSGERHRRTGQTQAPIGKGKPFVGNLIVMGASAGGHYAFVEILRDLSIDIPAAIVVLVHTSAGSEYVLKGFLGRSTDSYRCGSAR